jgi:hypothetical protein
VAARRQAHPNLFGSTSEAVVRLPLEHASKSRFNHLTFRGHYGQESEKSGEENSKENRKEKEEVVSEARAEFASPEPSMTAHDPLRCRRTFFLELERRVIEAGPWPTISHNAFI